MPAEPDQSLLAGAAAGGVFERAASPAAARAAAQAAGLVLVEADVGAAPAARADKRAVLQALAQAFAFGPAFGHNLDALFDSLAERDADTLLVLRRLPRDAASTAILDTLRDVADDYAARGRRFVVLWQR